MSAKPAKLPQTLEYLPYFHRWIHRFDTKDVLEENGDLLLRRTKVTGASDKLAVSVLWAHEIRHFPIQQMSDGRFRFESRSFRMVKDLIRWHQVNSVPVTEESGVLLKVGKPLMDWAALQLSMEEDEIHIGRFGDTFEGRILLRKDATERVVAMKTISSGRDVTQEEFEEAREALLHEARCLRELGDHSNIIKCFGVTINTRCATMVMELMSGNLADRLKEKPAVKVEAKLKFAKSAAAALSFIHCHNMVHRNICARNCLILSTEAGETMNFKLTGFDFCAKLSSDGTFTEKSMANLS